jgi:hypothetical protein
MSSKLSLPQSRLSVQLVLTGNNLAGLDAFIERETKPLGRETIVG